MNIEVREVSTKKQGLGLVRKYHRDKMRREMEFTKKRGNEKHDTYLSCTVSELFKPSYREAGDGKENECKVVTKRNERSIKYDEQPYNKKMIVIEAKIKGIDDTLEHVTEETLKNKCGENLGR